LELEVMKEHKWWKMADLKRTRDTVWPENLPEILGYSGE
jgi:hypothetical protein